MVLEPNPNLTLTLTLNLNPSTIKRSKCTHILLRDMPFDAAR